MLSLGAYRQAFLVELQATLRYRGNVLAYLSYVLVPPVAVFFLWKTVLGEGGWLGDYDLRAMVTYYLVTQLFVANTPFGAWSDIGEEIRNGRLALWLLRPAGHYGLYLSRILGSWVVPYWGMSLLGTAVVAAVLHRYFQLQTDSRLLAAALLFWLGGVVIAFTWGYLLNLAAFWTQRALGALLAADAVATFLAGGVIPLDLLPLKGLWLFLPFRYAGWLPTQIYLGRVPLESLPLEFLKLLAWLIALRLLVKLVWHRGLMRFQGAGI